MKKTSGHVAGRSSKVQGNQVRRFYVRTSPAASRIPDYTFRPSCAVCPRAPWSVLPQRNHGIDAHRAPCRCEHRDDRREKQKYRGHPEGERISGVDAKEQRLHVARPDVRNPQPSREPDRDWKEPLPHHELHDRLR